jgi:hypothetical protein
MSSTFDGQIVAWVVKVVKHVGRMTAQILMRSRTLLLLICRWPCAKGSCRKSNSTRMMSFSWDIFVAIAYLSLSGDLMLVGSLVLCFVNFVFGWFFVYLFGRLSGCVVLFSYLLVVCLLELLVWCWLLLWGTYWFLLSSLVDLFLFFVVVHGTCEALVWYGTVPYLEVPYLL